jgi:hypothetical protein
MDVWQFWDLRSTFVYDLVGIWPTIRALRLCSSIIENNGPLPERPSISLRELRLPHSHSLAVIEWFLPPPPPDQRSNLLFLELADITEEARAALSVHGQSVSTLALLNQPSFEIARLFPRLEELVIMGPFWRSPLPAFPITLKHIRLARGHLSTGPTAAVTQVVPILPDLRVISIEEKFTTHEHYLNLKEVCEAHRVEILVSSLDSSGRQVVSTYQSPNMLCLRQLSLTATISIPITERWIAFLDSTRSPSSSTVRVEAFENIFQLSGWDTYKVL